VRLSPCRGRTASCGSRASLSLSLGRRHRVTYRRRYRADSVPERQVPYPGHQRDAPCAYNACTRCAYTPPNRTACRRPRRGRSQIQRPHRHEQQRRLSAQIFQQHIHTSKLRNFLNSGCHLSLRCSFVIFSLRGGVWREGRVRDALAAPLLRPEGWWRVGARAPSQVKPGNGARVESSRAAAHESSHLTPSQVISPHLISSHLISSQARAEAVSA
jgi:hypothetical protein